MLRLLRFDTPLSIGSVLNFRILALTARLVKQRAADAWNVGGSLYCIGSGWTHRAGYWVTCVRLLLVLPVKLLFPRYCTERLSFPGD